MNLDDPKHPWSRLAAAARRAPDARDTAAPYGFATRVSALALAADHSAVSLFERLSWRALGVACLLALASFAVNYSAVTGPQADDDLPIGGEDAVAVLLDLS
jgi:hypothetical protein